MDQRCPLLPLLLLLVLAVAEGGSDPANATTGNKWTGPDILAGSNGVFGCGILSCRGCTGFYFAIYFRYIGEIVWMANANRSVSQNATLRFQEDGNLVLREANGAIAWESRTGKRGVTSMELTDSGNLVLATKNGRVLWQSFDSPVDKLVTGQRLNVGDRLESRISLTDMNRGDFYLEVEKQGVYSYARGSSGAHKYGAFCELHGQIGYIQFEDGKLVCYRSNGIQLDTVQAGEVFDKNYTTLGINPSGALMVWAAEWPGTRDHVPLLGITYGATPCKISPGICGRFGICTGNGECSCAGPSLSFKNISSQGCQLNAAPVCGPSTVSSQQNKLIELPGNLTSLLTGYSTPLKVSLEECKLRCLNNCSCNGLVFDDLLNQCFLMEEIYTFFEGRLSKSFVKVGPSPSEDSRGSSPVLRMLPVIVVVVVVVLVLIVLCFFYRRSKVAAFLPCSPNTPQLFSYQQLCDMTANFSSMLGSGGFGTVYQGTLPDGTLVAVKELTSAKHGMEQFKAEVMTIGSVHHKNLVKLLGYGADLPQYYLVYEFMPNLSLDKWLFTEDKARALSWEQRYKIALDITKGLHYLHEECQERVLHLDIKPQNILLDINFQAKICDFGLAKLMTKGETSIHDARMQGTPGYMAPEVLKGRVTDKTDVYSYGIVLLEILSGKKTVPLPVDLSSHGMARLQDFAEQEDNVVHGLATCLLLEQAKGGLVLEQMKRFAAVGVLCTDDRPDCRPSMRCVLRRMLSAEA